MAEAQNLHSCMRPFQPITTHKVVTEIGVLLTAKIPKNPSAFALVCSHVFSCITPRGTVEDLLTSNSHIFMVSVVLCLRG